MVIILITIIVYLSPTYKFIEFYGHCYSKSEENNNAIDINFFLDVINSDALNLLPPTYGLKKSKNYDQVTLYQIQKTIWKDIRLVSILNSYGEKLVNKQCKSTTYYSISSKRYDYLISLYKNNNTRIEYVNNLKKLNMNIEKLEKNITIMNIQFDYMDKIINDI